MKKTKQAKIKCINCKNVLEKGERYILEPYFDEPCCEECYPELKQYMIESEDWISLHMVDTKEWIEIK